MQIAGDDDKVIVFPPVGGTVNAHSPRPSVVLDCMYRPWVGLDALLDADLLRPAVPTPLCLRVLGKGSGGLASKSTDASWGASLSS